MFLISRFAQVCVYVNANQVVSLFLFIHFCFLFHTCCCQCVGVHAASFFVTHTLLCLFLSSGTNSKHVDLKLNKMVEVSPRGVTSPSSLSSTSSSSSPTASSTSPLSPAEGLEVRAYSPKTPTVYLFILTFPYFHLCVSPSLSVFFPPLPPCSVRHQRVQSIRSDWPWLSADWPFVHISQLDHFM